MPSLRYFYKFLSKLNMGLFLIFCIVFIISLASALLFSPADYQQGDGVRIMYIHVPSAILSLVLYVIASIFALIALINKKNYGGYIFVRAILPIGAFFTIITLFTGSFWGKPMWGTWWIWDARLTSELILLFIYIGAIGLGALSYDKFKSSRLSAVFLLVGLLDIPIVHYSVTWWSTLHQGSGIVFRSSSSFSASGMGLNYFMIFPLVSMSLALCLFILLVFSINMQREILLWTKDEEWTYNLLSKDKK